MFRVLLGLGGALAGFALGFMASGRHRMQIADRAVDAAHARLRGRRASFGDLEVDTVFYYGAVDINAEHCVVWILVKGSDSLRIPAWLTLDADGRVRADKSLDDDLATWLAELHREVREDFAHAGWSSRPTPSIGFESVERVSRGGGQFFYFK